MKASQNPLQQLEACGQSLWLDFIERGFLRRGELAALIRDDGVSGVTSNPTIFHQAITQHAAYDGAIDALTRRGLAAHEIHEALMIDDIRAAADELVRVFESTAGRDGYVSLEVSPHHAHDTDATYWEAKRLWTLVNRPNLMIKVPGTLEGASAIRRLVADGVNVNVTLLFSMERYAAVAEAFALGLSDRAELSLPLDRIASVASFFVSRIDTLIDAQLDRIGSQEALDLRGTCAIACARAAYRHYQTTLDGSRWRSLRAMGARPQRLLWASTGTKDPSYDDVKYVEPLIGANTVTTLPMETLRAYRDHGKAIRTLPMAATESEPSMTELSRRLSRLGIDWDRVASQLEEEGIRKFVLPHEATLAALRKRIGASKS